MASAWPGGTRLSPFSNGRCTCSAALKQPKNSPMVWPGVGVRSLVVMVFVLHPSLLRAGQNNIPAVPGVPFVAGDRVVVAGDKTVASLLIGNGLINRIQGK